MIIKYFYIDSTYFTHISNSLYNVSGCSNDTVGMIQHYSVLYAIESMYYNEYSFYLHPNTEAFIQSRLAYQEELKVLSDKLNFNDFLLPKDELKFFTVFYDHYLEIIELNNELIKNKIINK